MRRIVKQRIPVKLTAWIRINRPGIKHYERLTTVVMTDVKQALLVEQGYICAYTGMRVEEATSHIEHLSPRARRIYLEDVKYGNLVACYPKDSEGGSNGVKYGAVAKGNWWSATDFVSPLNRHCGTRFRYTLGGKVHPNPENQQASKTTIEKLKLNDRKLQQLRRKAIVSFFGLNEGKRSKSRAVPMTKAKAQAWTGLIGQVDGHGRFQPYCFVMDQLLPTYIRNLP